MKQLLSWGKRAYWSCCRRSWGRRWSPSGFLSMWNFVYNSFVSILFLDDFFKNTVFTLCFNRKKTTSEVCGGLQVSKPPIASWWKSGVERPGNWKFEKLPLGVSGGFFAEGAQVLWRAGIGGDHSFTGVMPSVPPKNWGRRGKWSFWRTISFWVKFLMQDLSAKVESNVLSLVELDLRAEDLDRCSS